MDELMRYREVAEHCGVSVKTVSRWVKDGLLKAITLGSRTRRIRRADLEMMLADASKASE